MTKRLPTGVGMWITFNGRSTTDVDNATIIELAKRAGLGWLCVKSGDRGRSTRWLARGADLITRANDAGIPVYTWNYSTPESWPFQADEIARLIEQGSAGHVIDAEMEWEGIVAGHDTRPAASAFMSRLRASVGDAFIAHAPIWLPSAHATFPHREFGERCDAVMPQYYWPAAMVHAVPFCTHADSAWDSLKLHDPGAVPALWPVGITYGGGDGWDLWTSKPGTPRLTEEELDAFLQRYADRPVSLFSWDAANAATWNVLNRYAAARTIAGEKVLNRLPDEALERGPDTERAPSDHDPTS